MNATLEEGISTVYYRASLLAFFSVATMTAQHAHAECERKTIAMLMAPRNDWLALVQQQICSGPGLASTGIDDIVQITRPGEDPTIANDVFSTGENGNWVLRPALAWLEPRKLQIKVINKAIVGLRKRTFEDVEIVVKFEPDDPEARAQFLKERGLPPD